jgi:DNA-directed RNA polymerase sigma subunit (sigma70/sigma32)
MRSFIKNSKYYERAFYGPSFDDRVAAGIAGLMNAIEKYNLAPTVLASRLNAQPSGRCIR